MRDDEFPGYSEGMEPPGDQNPFEGSELRIHDPYVLPSDMELEHEIERPKWWYAQQLRLAGASWDEIAKAIGYTDGSSARRVVAFETKDWKLENAAELVRMELERLDMLQLVVWRKARQGSLRDIDAVLKIMAMRAKYLGIDQGTHGADEDNEKAGVIVIGGNTEEYIEAIKQANRKHQAPVEGEVAG